MTNPKYNFSIYTEADGILIKPSTVDANTVGDRVTNPADLTVGRWYAVFTNATSPHTLLRAKYLGSDVPANHVFTVCPEDYDSIPAVSRELIRTSENLRTGKDMGGGTFGVYKFKQANQQNAPKPKGVKPMVNEVSPYEDSMYANCARYGLKPGDKFKVVDSKSHSGINVGDVVTLMEDDGSACLWFNNETTGRGYVVICLYRLVPLVTNPAQPIATLSTVDQFKSEIDALRAKVEQKRDQIAQLSEEIAGITVAIDDTRQKFKASLDGYI